MSKLLITCPVTNEQVFTGLCMELVAFQQAVTIFRFSELKCPRCGAIHSYEKQDIYIEDQPDLDYRQAGEIDGDLR
jgi:hypothetical protein